MNLYFDVGRDAEILILGVPGQSITFGRGPRHIFGMTSQLLDIMQPVLVASDAGLRVRVFTRSRMTLIARDFSREERHKIVVAFENRELVIPAKSVAGSSWIPPAMLLFSGEQARKQYDVETRLDSAVIARPRFSFEARRARTTYVGEVFVRAPGGRLIVEDGAQPLTLERSDELFLGGDQLTVRKGNGGEMLIEGSSREVAVNRVLRSRSVWNSLPVDARTAAIAAFVSVAGQAVWRRVRLYRRRARRGESRGA